MEVRPLTEELAEVARIELNETPIRLEESLSFLKYWIRKQTNLRARTDDQWLAAFIRSSKFNLEKAKEKIDIYYSLRSIAPDLFCLKHTNPKVMDILDLGIGLVLPKCASPTAPRVVLIRPGSYDPDKYSIMEIMAVTIIQQQICYMEDDNLIVSGSVNVVDLQGTKLRHVAHITPIQVKKIVTANQEAAPTRMKAVHFLNMPPFIETIFNLTKSFLNEKNKQRLHIHGKGYTALYEHIPKNILPLEYGGSEYTIQNIKDHWKNKFHQYHAWLEEDMQYGKDEDNRSGKFKDDGITFGVQGSFRRLEFD